MIGFKSQTKVQYFIYVIFHVPICPAPERQVAGVSWFLGKFNFAFSISFPRSGGIIFTSGGQHANNNSAKEVRRDGERTHNSSLGNPLYVDIKYSSLIPVTKESGWSEIVCLPSSCLSVVVSTARWRQLLWLPWPAALLRPAPQPPGDIEMEQIQETGILRTPRKLAREGGGGKRCQCHHIFSWFDITKHIAQRTWLPRRGC